MYIHIYVCTLYVTSAFSIIKAIAVTDEIKRLIIRDLNQEENVWVKNNSKEERVD